MLYKSFEDVVRLSVGESPVTLAKGPAAGSCTLPEAVDAASSSSPATYELNLAHIDPDTLSILGFEIHEPEPSLGACRSLS